MRKEDHETEFREAFNAFDWNHSGKISYGSLQVILYPPPPLPLPVSISTSELFTIVTQMTHYILRLRVLITPGSYETMWSQPY